MKLGTRNSIELLGASPARLAILEFFMHHPGSHSRVEVANALGMAESGIRRHLDALEDVGVLEPNVGRDDVRRGKVVRWAGRPDVVRAILDELRTALLNPMA